MLKSTLSLAALLSVGSLGLLKIGPQWRGPRGDGVSQAKNVATKWSKTEHVAWRAPLPGQGGATRRFGAIRFLLRRQMAMH